MATRLTGDPTAAGVVTAEVFRRLHRQPPPRPPVAGDAASRWFAHHTVLASREWPWSGGNATPGTALLAALPPQQREALILAHLERFDVRQLAVAMDCSLHAAERHLAAAKAAVVNAGLTAESALALPAANLANRSTENSPQAAAATSALDVGATYSCGADNRSIDRTFTPLLIAGPMSPTREQAAASSLTGELSPRNWSQFDSMKRKTGGRLTSAARCI